ncbi:TPA: hypothetical protein ACIDLI_000657 [Shigella sonnei]
MSAWSPEHITLRRTENGNVIAHDSRDDRKRKLTAVCSHQTRIGNLDAHLI